MRTLHSCFGRYSCVYILSYAGAASDQNGTQPTSEVNATMTPTQPPTTNKPSGNDSFNETVTSSTPTSESVELSVKQPDTHGLLQRSLYVVSELTKPFGSLI